METPDTIPRARSAFHVLIKPLGPICNLRCAYCFYLEKEQLFAPGERFAMTDEVLAEFTRQYIAGQPEGVEEVNFAWQGGEPTLMGLDFFRRAVRLQEACAAQLGRRGLRVTNSLQTNGTLLDDEWGRFLHQERFLVGLSVDGPKELHDRFRLDRQGRGSFDAVLRGLEVLKRHQVQFNALTVVQSHNADEPCRVYDFLVEAGFRFIQLIPIVTHLPGEGVARCSVTAGQFGRFLSAVFDRWLKNNHVGEVFVQMFDVMLGIVMNRPAALCVHAKTCGRALALEHNGDLFSCDHWVFPENRLGNIAETSLVEMVDGERQTTFGRSKFDGLPGFCRACRYLRYCHGGCPKDRFTVTGDGEAGLHDLCQGYRLFYEHSLPVLHKMAKCLRAGRPASDYRLADRLDSAGAPGGAGGKPGRNDLCPCGSGLKYKRCCGRKP